MVPAPAAILALLALKLLDKERRSHIDDFNLDQATGLFAGLNVLPKKSFVTAYSYRTIRDNQLGLLGGWVPALAPCCSPRPIPSRWTSIPSPTGATRPGSISTICRSAARPDPAS